MQFAATMAGASLSLLTACVCQASEYPCGLANAYVLKVKSWTAELKPAGTIEISITVGKNDIKPHHDPSSVKVAKLDGFAGFEFNGGSTAAFALGDPAEPIGLDDSYVYRETIDATSNNTPIVEQSKSDVRAFACVANWTLTNGQEWIAN